jgi:hypothetical protein
MSAPSWNPLNEQRRAVRRIRTVAVGHDKDVGRRGMPQARQQGEAFPAPRLAQNLRAAARATVPVPSVEALSTTTIRAAGRAAWKSLRPCRSTSPH